MALTLKQQAAQDVDLLFSDDMQWEIDCSYQPVSGGAPSTISIFNSGQIDTFSRLEDYERGANTSELYVWVKKVDVTNPKWRDAYTFNGETWYHGVLGVVKEDAYSLKIHLERDLTC